MKNATKQRRWFSGFLVHAVGVLCIGALAAGCQKPFEQNLSLAVNSDRIDLANKAGSTHILVYSTGDWTATFTEDVEWASLSKLSGHGNADLVFTYSANYGVSRSVGVVFSSGDRSVTVTLVQAAGVDNPALSFVNRSMTLLSAASTHTVAVTNNMPYELDNIKMKVYQTVDDGEDDETEVRSEDIVSWISDVSFDLYSLTFTASSYTGSTPRVAYITLSLRDADEVVVSTTLTITQNNETPSLVLSKTEDLYFGVGQAVAVPAITNLLSYGNLVRFTVDYENEVAEDKNWIQNIKLATEGLVFSLTENDSNELRSAEINISFTDSEGNAIDETFKVSQRFNPVISSFATVRGKIAGATGELTFADNVYIEGFVISDPASGNVTANPQTALYTFDYNDNWKNAYVESIDGQYGFCIKFNTKDDNILKRYSKVQINLKGATMVKSDAPVRYTISGLNVNSVFYASEPDKAQVPVKNMTVAQLTDADIYTWVSLQNVEIVFKDGAYTNVTDGYTWATHPGNPMGTGTAARCDAAPLLLTDNTGSSMYMVTNMAVEWRRNNTGLLPDGLPKGAGTFNGVIVHDEMVPIRYGDLGRYQIRAMMQDDIALGSTPFSKTIVEWNWNDAIFNAALPPNIGTGAFVLHGATAATGADYNDILSTGTAKGVVNNKGIFLHNFWWDFDNDEGRYFDVEFSTSDLTGTNLTFGFVWNHGTGGDTTLDSPANWKMSYSVDGETFLPVEGAQSIVNRTVVWWNNANGPTAQDAAPGFRDFMFKLPNSCFGKEKVTVRLQPADKTCDVKPTPFTNDSWQNNLIGGRGTLTNKSTGIRFGALTVRYN